ncbi:MAG: polysaccharide biosynthesis/export family protein, partial [Caulobacteraceae bacterium]
MRHLLRFVLLTFLTLSSALAQPARPESVLGVGDVIRVTVYQNPDLSVEARISELGQINVPLIGSVT